MNGPDHFREGEHFLTRCLDFSQDEQRRALAAEATAHFLAALVAVVATDRHPDSIAWQQALNPEETP